MKIETETTENLGRKQSIMKHRGKKKRIAWKLCVGISHCKIGQLQRGPPSPSPSEQVVKQPKHGHLQVSRRNIHYSHTHTHTDTHVAREEITK